ncbi:SRPBCC domain-containing protein [Niabella sp. CC-SYL272]|uniref:SRPBCC family protein n=1 Tax=Niabella agricola TaxID=2891571 RepID=UPI001F25D9F9|nr:SRPBCC family protein [Niabella agricola]MCF3108361.1 SRPBCC domain-containing protein [Niabella agricola]
MNPKNLIATAQITVNAPVSKVWDALVNPDLIKKYMFGAAVSSNWTQGSKITWKGMFNGKEYEDKGVLLEVLPEKRLVYSHFSALSGKPDIPENYHTVTIVLNSHGNQTQVKLEQDKNETEKSKAESEQNWGVMLNGLKNLLEGS